MSQREGRGTWRMLKRWLPQACIVSMIVLAAAHPAYAEHGGPPVCVSCALEWEPATFGPVTASGTVSIDDDDPAGTGLTIKSLTGPRTGNDTLSTVAAFEQGLNALDGFVNGIEIPFGSSDAGIDDEFRPELEGVGGQPGAIEQFIQDIQAFRTAIVEFDRAIKETDQPPGDFGTASLTGINPVTYTWIDSRGTQRVTAHVGDFKLAWVRKTQTGSEWFVRKTCVKLKDSNDPGGERSWVRITREDPTADIGGPGGALWRWNASGRAITKTAHAGYDVDYVRLVNAP
ncbi:MAG: hypothetical protein Q8R91_07445 [Candidatus Omnitrophota bacterium]|nr:hypothetical protein [Candidatus Omnitrophota bacterium]